MLEPWHIWIIAGLVFWIIEIFTPGFVLGVFGTACLIVAPFAGADLTLKMQLLVFGIATAALSLGIRPLILRYLHGREVEVKTNADALVGMSGQVTDVIDNASGTGSARIGGEVWRAVTPDGSRIEVGQTVTVQDIDGCKVVVAATTSEQEGIV